MAGGTFGGGTGTVSNPFLVQDGADLNAIRGTNLTKHFKQVANVDLNGYANFVPIGTSASRFTGSYDGNGFSVANLKMNSVLTGYIGLFGYASGASGSLRNITILSGTITATGIYVGAVCGFNTSEIKGCKNLGCTITKTGGTATTTSFVGGITGNGSATDCHNAANVNATGVKMGGITSFGTCRNCTNTGNITSTGNSASGINGSGASFGCVNEGRVTSVLTSSGITTGIGQGDTTDCHNKATLFGGNIFSIGNGIAIRCSNTANQSGVGTISGICSNRDATDCFNTGHLISTEGNAYGISFGNCFRCINTGDLSGYTGVVGVTYLNASYCYGLQENMNVISGFDPAYFSFGQVTSNTWVSAPGNYALETMTFTIDNVPSPMMPNKVAPNYVNDSDSRKAKTYSDNTWGMGTVWGIKEKVSRPRLLVRDVITDPVLSTRKIYVFVEEAEDGSLFYAGKIYKSLKRTITGDSIVGLEGGTVTHSFGGVDLNDSLGLPYVYKASGVQDPLYAGGYGDLNTETQRTVTLRTDRSNNVAFYYAVASVAPSYDYLLSIQGNSMVFHIAVFLTDVSEIKVVMGDGSIAYVGLVPIDDPTASLIRVLTLDGIFALQGVEGVEQPAPMMAMMFAAPEPYVTETEYRITYPRTSSISTIGKTGSSLFAAPFISNGGDIREVSLHGKKREEGADIRIAIAKDLNNKPDMTKILYQGSLRMFPTDLSKMTESVSDIPTMNGETLWLMFDARESTAGTGDAGTATDGIGPFKYSNDNGVTWLTHTNYLAMDVLLVTKTAEGEF